MDDVEREFLDGLRRCFADLPDPRVVGRCDHLLLDIVAIAILAMLCGAEDWPDIELSPGTATELIDADRGEA